MIKAKVAFWRAGFFPANQGFLKTFGGNAVKLGMGQTVDNISIDFSTFKNTSHE